MRVLRQRDFRNLFIGQAASTIGDRIVFVALALYVTEIGSPIDVGIVLAAATFPLVAFLLIGGVWADRLPRHRMMIVTDLVRFALHALLAALIFTGSVEIWHLVVIEALFGTAEAFFPAGLHGARPAALAERVPPHTLSRVSAYDWMGSLALLPLGYLLSGPLGEALGPALVLASGARWPRSRSPPAWRCGRRGRCGASTRSPAEPQARSSTTTGISRSVRCW